MATARKERFQNGDSPAQATRLRLLESAGDVFARRGYRDATIREICRHADANVSAVKYHFGDKSRLYLATLEYAIACSADHYPFDAAEDPAMQPREQLRTFIAIFLRRLLDTGRPAWHGRLLLRELTEPTEGFDIIAGEIHDNLVARLSPILGRMLPETSPTRLREAAYCVLGQCTFYRHARRYLDKFDPQSIGTPTDIEAIADRVYRFSLAALENPTPKPLTEKKSKRR